MTLRPVATLVVLCTFLVELPTRQLSVRAQEESQPAHDVEVASEEQEDEDADVAVDPAVAGEDAEARAASFTDSARELQEKLGQLKALLDKRGDATDPELKERLKGLEQQLSSLGLDGLAAPAAGSNPELTEFLSSCVMMAMTRVGMRRPSTLGALRQLSEDKLKPAQAAESNIFQMVAVCLNEITDAQLKQFKDGKLTMLPKALVDKAAKPDAKAQVLNLEAGLWAELRFVCAALVKKYAGEVEKPPVMYGLLAAVPLIGMFAFLAKKFLDMKRSENARKEKSAKKKQK